jgi:hypothetical protein
VKLFKQECPLALLYLAAALYAVVVVLGLATGAYTAAVATLILTPLVWWAVRRFFPHLSVWFGYGRVDDQPPPATQPSPLPTAVTLYSAAGCLFCPIVKQRLAALQAEIQFALEIVDVTLRPDILLAKGYAAVPVIEAGSRRLVGNATSAQLAELLRAASAEALAVAAA